MEWEVDNTISNRQKEFTSELLKSQAKQGYISKSYESIICLPNKIVIKLENNSDIDVIAG